MNKKLKNRIVFYTMLLVLFVIVNIVVSFAYLRGRANNNESVSTIAIEGGGSISVVYSDNTGDIVNDHIIPGYQTIKQFSVTSNISSGGQVYKRGIWYQIKLIVENNGFESGFFVYSLSLDENSSTDGIVALPVDNVEIPFGSNLDLLVGTGYFLNDNVTHIYNLKINYLNMDDVDQTANSQTKFFARVVIDSPEYINLTFDLDGGSFDMLTLNKNSSMKVAANSAIDFPIPTKDGYAFSGWEKVSGNVSISNTLISTGSNDINLKASWLLAVYKFDYTGGEQEFIAENSGYYKIETWGAQGGGNNGGYGSYSVGNLRINKDDKMYITIGGTTSSSQGGYNGGGTASGGYGGGGATHIANISGMLSSLSPTTNIDNILIVSGAGGGQAASGAGGAGGGISGNNGVDGACSNKSGGGGTQLSGGICVDSSYCNSGQFGVGGSYKGGTNGGAGGGGFYGGGSGTAGNCYGGGGGGSGYIGNSLLTDKYMYCYNCSTSDVESTKTYTTTCAEDTPTENCAKIGNGYARITFLHS